jgi:hypothetical protein
VREREREREREKPRKELDEEALLLARDRESRVPK